MQQKRNKARLQQRRKLFWMRQQRKRRRRRQQMFVRGTAVVLFVLAFCISIRFLHTARSRQTVEGATQEPVTTETNAIAGSGKHNTADASLMDQKNKSTTTSIKNMKADQGETKNTADTSTDRLENTSTDTASEFSDAVFIGDSRTEGFVLQTGIQTTAYVHKGLTVASAYTAKVIRQDGEDLSVMEALARTRYNRVYLMFGINETGWISNDIFISDYKQIIDDIKAQNPSAQIYIQSVLPVSEAVSDSGGYVRNDKIAEYNKRLEQLATDEGVTFVNVAEAVSTDGVLPDDAATDGIHLDKEYCEKWLSYLEAHTLDK